MVSSGTAITGDETINYHVVKNVDEKIFSQLIGRQFINIKMKRSENVRFLETMTFTVKIKDKVVAIKPMVLYQSMLFVKNSNDLADYFKYKLAS